MTHAGRLRWAEAEGEDWLRVVCLSGQAEEPLARFVLSRVMASHKEAEEDLLPR